MRKYQMPERIPTKEFHQSQRGYFAGELYNQMLKNDKLVVITADLGFGMFSKIEKDFPDRFHNPGAAEQVAMGMAVGFAMKGFKPVVYSITPFLLYRPYEWLRNYVNAEKYDIILAGSGRDKDYEHNGLTHWAEEAKDVLATLPNIKTHWPEGKEDVVKLVQDTVGEGGPHFISLKR